MLLTVFLGLTAAACWGVPDVWLAQATRNVGPFPVVFGAMLIGVAAIAPAALFVGLPDWTSGGVALGILLGALTVVAYQAGFVAFRNGAVSIVAPIISCEGAVAAALAIAAGEELRGAVVLFLGLAVVGVVLAAMGEGGGRAGALPAAVCACVWGVILVLSNPVSDDLGVFWGFMLIRVSGLVLILPLALRSGAVTRWRRDPWRVAAWGFGDSFAYLAFVAAANNGPVAVASVLAAQFATVAVLVATAFFGERPRRRQLVGVALVIAAVSAIAAVSG
ncbi:MAG: DMT family transporter [Actinomycetota bacterium]|nr:DMT family transporter [Actinomycetota bacterium]